MACLMLPENVDNILVADLVDAGLQTVTTEDFDNPDHRGLYLVINIQSQTTGGNFTVTVQGKDPVSGAVFGVGDISIGGPRTNEVKTIYVYPGPNGNASLPRTWNVKYNVSGSSVVTAKISASLLK